MFIIPVLRPFRAPSGSGFVPSTVCIYIIANIYIYIFFKGNQEILVIYWGIDHNVTLFQNNRTDETPVFVFSAWEPQDLMDKYKDKDVVEDLIRKKALWGSIRVIGVYIYNIIIRF